MKLGAMLPQDLLKNFFFNFPDFESSIHSFKEYLKDKYKKENESHTLSLHLEITTLNI